MSVSNFWGAVQKSQPSILKVKLWTGGAVAQPKLPLCFASHRKISYLYPVNPARKPGRMKKRS